MALKASIALMAWQRQWPGNGPAMARQWPGNGPAMAPCGVTFLRPQQSLQPQQGSFSGSVDCSTSTNLTEILVLV